MTNRPVFIGLLMVSLLGAGCFSTRFSPSAPQQEPVPGANHFVIRTVDAPEVAREKMADLLRRQDFSFDTETGPTIVTNWKATPALADNARLKISAFIENESNATTITLRGRVRTDAFGDTAIENTGHEDSVAQEAFALLEDIAYAYSDGTVYYARD